MKNIFTLFCILILSVCTTQAQGIWGTKTIPSANYPTVKVAIDSINALGVGSPGITFNITPGHYERSALAVIGSSSGTQPIVFKKNGPGVNPIITAQNGTGAYDAVLRIQGRDNVSLEGITLKDTSANSNFMESGVAMFRNSGTNGCKNTIIRNCIIQMRGDSVNPSFGIGSFATTSAGTVITPTGSGYTTTGHIYDGNQISGALTGIYMTGNSSSTYYGSNNQIGQLSGNTISLSIGGDIGGGNLARGIHIEYSDEDSIRLNTIIFSGRDSFSGITYQGDEPNTHISRNTISVNSGSNYANIYGIRIIQTVAGTTNKVSIDSNNLTNWNLLSLANGNVYGIYNLHIIPTFYYVRNNTLNQMIIGSNLASPAGTFIGIGTSGTSFSTASSVTKIINNTLTNIHRFQSVASGGDFELISLSAGRLRMEVTGNNLSTGTVFGTGKLAGIHVNYSLANAQRLIQDNELSYFKRGTGSTGITRGIDIEMGESTGSDSIYDNFIHDFTFLGSSIVTSMYLRGNATTKVLSNVINHIYGNTHQIKMDIYIGGTNPLIVQSNSVNITDSSTTGDIVCIKVSKSGTLASTLDVENNTITGSVLNRTGSFTFSGIWLDTLASLTEVKQNTFNQIDIGKATSSGSLSARMVFSEMNNTQSGASLAISDNLCRNNSIVGTSLVYANFYFTELIKYNDIYEFNNNIIDTIDLSGNSSFHALYTDGVNLHGNQRKFNENKVSNITASVFRFLYLNSKVGAIDTIQGNRVKSCQSNSTGTSVGIWYENNGDQTNQIFISQDSIYDINGGIDIFGIYLKNNTGSFQIHKSVIYNLNNASSSGRDYGIYVIGSPNSLIMTNNIIGGFSPANGGSSAGIYTSSTNTNIQLYYNTIYLDASTTSLHGSSCVFSTAPLLMKYNIFINKSSISHASSKRNIFNIDSELPLNYHILEGTSHNIYYLPTSSSQSAYLTSDYYLDSTFNQYTQRLMALQGGARELSTYTENVSFANTTTISSTLLRPLLGTASYVESSGETSFTSTYDDISSSNIRTGYPKGGQANGGGQRPDRGAREYDGTPKTSMSISSIITEQASVYRIGLSQRHAEVLKIKITTTGSGNPLTISNLTLSNSGTGGSSDFDSVSIFNTGNSEVFSDDGLITFDSVFSTSFNPQVTLQEGLNVLWISYSVKSSATIGNTADAQLTSITTQNGTQSHSNNPSGSRAITGPFCGTYPVGSGQFFATITQAAYEMHTIGINPSCSTTTYLELRDANYSSNETFPIRFKTIPNSNNTRPVQLYPATGVTSTIEGSNPYTLIEFDGIRNFYFYGMGRINLKNNQINTSSIYQPSCISLTKDTNAVYGSLGLTIGNCTFYSSTGSSYMGNNTICQTYGITTSRFELNGMPCASQSNLTIQSCNFYNIGHAINLLGTSSSPLTSYIISNNNIGSADTLQFTGVRGISLTHAGYGNITFNRIQNLIQKTSIVNPVNYGIVIYEPLNNTTININNNLIRNLMTRLPSTTNHGTTGIGIGGGSTVRAIDARIVNNVIYNLSSNGGNLNGLFTSGISGITIGQNISNAKILHNSINLYGLALHTSPNSAHKTTCINLFSTDDSIQIQGNIFANRMNNPNGQDSAHAFFSDEFGTNLLVSNYNIFHADRASRFSTYRNASGGFYILNHIQFFTGKEANSKVLRPIFNADTNLICHRNSPAGYIAPLHSLVNFDFFGTTRTNPTSAGAYKDTSDRTAPLIIIPAIPNAPFATTYAINSLITVVDTPGTQSPSSVMYYKKPSNADVLGGTNDHTADGWKFVNGSRSGNFANFTVDFTKLYGGYASGDSIQFFIVATDNHTSPSLSSSAQLASSLSSTTLSSAHDPVSGFNTFRIQPPLTGWVDVGPGSPYKSLTGDTGIFKAINNNIVTGDLNIRIRGNLYETGLHQLDSIDNYGSYKIKIYSDGGTYGITSYTSGYPIRLMGADYVTIDGRDTATLTGRKLIFRNRNVNGYVIEMKNDASFDTIRNCEFSGTNGSFGLISFTFSSLGNNNNAIIENLFKETPGLSGYPQNGIYSMVKNDSLTIKDNYFLNIYSSPIYFGGSNSGQISILSNHIYDNSTFEKWNYYGIYVNTTNSGGHIIRGNYIGGSAPYASGSKFNMPLPTITNILFYGIYYSSSASGQSSVISGNVIKNINIPNNTLYQTYFTGIYVNNGSSHKVTLGEQNYGNIIGDSSDTTSIYLGGWGCDHFLFNTTGAGPKTTQYNQIHGIKFNPSVGTNSAILYNLYSTNTGYDTIQFNDIGSANKVSVANSNTSFAFIGMRVQSQRQYVYSNTICNIHCYAQLNTLTLYDVASATAVPQYFRKNQLGSNSNESIKLYSIGTYQCLKSNFNNEVIIDSNYFDYLYAYSTSNSNSLTIATLYKSGSTSSLHFKANTFGGAGTNRIVYNGSNTNFNLVQVNTMVTDSFLNVGNLFRGITQSNASATSTVTSIYSRTTMFSPTLYMLDSANVIGDKITDGSITLESGSSVYLFRNPNANIMTSGYRMRSNKIGGWRQNATSTSINLFYINDTSNYSKSHIVSDNQAENCHFYSNSNPNIFSFYGFDNAISNFVFNNKITNIQFKGTPAVASGFYVSKGKWRFTNLDSVSSGENIFGDSNLSNNIQFPNGTQGYGIYYPDSTTSHYIHGAKIYNILSGTSAGLGGFCGIYSYGPNQVIQNSTIKNVNGYNNGSSSYNVVNGNMAQLTGIYAGSNSSGNDTITHNRISGLINNNGITCLASVAGIVSSGRQSYVVLMGNKIGALSGNYNKNVYGIATINQSTGITYRYIMHNQLAFNGQYNSQSNTFAIYDTSRLINSINYYYHNTIAQLGGSSSIYASGMYMTGAGQYYVRNNAIIMPTTSSNHNCIQANSGVTLNSDYNFFGHGDSTKVCRISGTYYSLRQLIAINRDKNSWFARNSAEFNISTLFQSFTGGNLNFNANDNKSWYAHGNGIVLSFPYAGFDHTMQARNTTVNMGVDIGSNEFTPTVEPPAATQTGSIALNSITTYTFGGREIASILWKGYNANLPSAVTVRYWPGTTPPDPTNNGTNPSAKYFNAYTQIDGTGGTSYEYDIRVWYAPHLLGSIPTELDIKMSKKPNAGVGNWKTHYGSTLDTTNNYVYLSKLNSFSMFTGSEDLNPLPVSFTRFNARPVGHDAVIEFTTLSASGIEGYQIQRLTQGQSWQNIRMIPARLPAHISQTYSFVDEGVGATFDHALYRVMPIEDGEEGSATLPALVQFSKTAGNRLYIVPQTAQLSLTLGQDDKQQIQMDICDLQGKVLIHWMPSVQKGHQFIDIPDYHQLAAGVYLLRTEWGDVLRFVK